MPGTTISPSPSIEKPDEASKRFLGCKARVNLVVWITGLQLATTIFIGTSRLTATATITEDPKTLLL